MLAGYVRCDGSRKEGIVGGNETDRRTPRERLAIAGLYAIFSPSFVLCVWSDFLI